MRSRPARSARSARTAAALAALTLALGACGGADDTIAADDVPASAAPPATTPEADLSASPSVDVPPAGSASASPSTGGGDPAGGTVPEGTGPRSVAVADLAVGDCFDDVDGALNEVAEVPVVPCDGPHANEVFAVLEQPGEEFPGAEEIRGLAEEGCSGAFEPYVGASLETSTLTPFPITPTAESWEQGDRQVVCVLTSAGPRVTSARDSGA